MHNDMSSAFPRYIEYDPVVPVWCVTPNLDRTIHRFFDTSPFSPSGRYLGLTRLPYEDRLPTPGDPAEIVVVDLETGDERVVAESRGWDTQLGAQVQWGVTDKQLFYNDLDATNWQPFGVLLDPFTGTKRVLDGTVYMVSPDGRWVASPCLLRIGVTQPGYGVRVPPEQVPANRGAPADDGVYITHVKSGEARLLVSLGDIVKACDLRLEEFAKGDFYSFHVKWNQQGTRLLLVLRWVPHGRGTRIRAQVITMKADASDIHVTIPASEWDKGGHHPNWCPDGETVMMNLRFDPSAFERAYQRLPGRLRRVAQRIFGVGADGMRFVQVRYDGTGYGLMSDSVVGTGHPSLHANGRHVITDAYPSEAVSYGDGTTPVRLIDLVAGSEVALIRINTRPPYRDPGNELRVDPHPAWDREYRRIAFNACADGTRRVYVADLTGVLVLQRQLG
jgi:hypothetical protein